MVKGGVESTGMGDGVDDDDLTMTRSDGIGLTSNGGGGQIWLLGEKKRAGRGLGDELGICRNILHS